MNWKQSDNNIFLFYYSGCVFEHGHIIYSFKYDQQLHNLVRKSNNDFSFSYHYIIFSYLALTVLIPFVC